MRKRIVILAISCVLALPSAAYQTSPADSAVQPKKKFIRVYMPPKQSVFMVLYKPGTLHLFLKINVMGSVKFEQDGFHFIPTKQSPEGYLPQDLFEKSYWYNSLLTDLVIPYESIVKIKWRRGVIKTTSGMKYKFFARRDVMKEINRDLLSHIGS